jgi:hypothetical protein
MCPQNFSIIGVILKKMKLIESEGMPPLEHQ